MSEWKEIKLKDFALINPRESLKKGVIAKKIPMENLQPFTKAIDSFVLEEYKGGVKFRNGDTLVARITPSLENGKTSYVDILNDNEIGFGSTEFIVLREKEGISDKHFLYYLAISPEFRDVAVKSMTGSSGRQRVQNDIIENYRFNLPPLPIQKKIAHILSTLDEKIELNRKMNETLESMAQAIFKSWFVDFDPVHAKAKCTSEAELEDAAKELGISKEVLALFPSEFEESELGMVPKGWEVVKIEKILKRHKAPKRYKKNEVFDYGKTMVLEQGADVILGYHNYDGEFKATPSEPMFIFGDHTCIMKLSTKAFSISENVIPLSGALRNGYWSYYAIYGKQTFQEYRRHWSELIVKDIVLAPIEICDYFAEKIQSLVLKTADNIFENNELKMIRDTLLPKLLSGELDVSKVKV